MKQYHFWLRCYDNTNRIVFERTFIEKGIGYDRYQAIMKALDTINKDYIIPDETVTIVLNIVKEDER